MGGSRTPETFKPLLAKIVSQPDEFTADDVKQSIEHLATPEAVSPAQIGAFLTALKLSGREHSYDTISACAQVMMAHAVPVSVESPDEFYVDIVGTGGDGYNTFNISTAAAIVAAGAGARVIKHGNSASTSSSGSADILRKMGCALPEPTSSPLPAIPFTFLLASHYHPAMARIGPARKTLPFRTLFNVLGPLINPARPKAMLLGVADPSLGPVFAQCLRTLGAGRAFVVCGKEKLDEISIAGPTWVWSLDGEGQISQFTIDPSDFGVASHPITSVIGSTPQENADVLTSLLNPNKPSVVPSNGSSVEAIRDHILINAAALLVVAGVATSYIDGVEKARKSLSDGSAWKALEIFRSQ